MRKQHVTREKGCHAWMLSHQHFQRFASESSRDCKSPLIKIFSSAELSSYIHQNADIIFASEFTQNSHQNMNLLGLIMRNFQGCCWLPLKILAIITDLSSKSSLNSSENPPLIFSLLFSQYFDQNPFSILTGILSGFSSKSSHNCHQYSCRVIGKLPYFH